MSDDSDDDVPDSAMNRRPRRASTRKSINSDDDVEKKKPSPPRSNVKVKAKQLSSESDSPSSKEQNGYTSEDSSTGSVPAKRCYLGPKKSLPKSQKQPRASAKGFVRDTYEPVRDRFLQDNQSGDSSLEEWIADDGEESVTNETDSDDSSCTEGSVLEESTDGQAAEDRNKAEKENAKGKPSKGSDDEEDEVSPSKKCRSQRIHSDDSESDSELSSQNTTESQGEVKKKRKRKHRRVIIVPDSLDVDDNQSGSADSSQSGSSDCDSSSEHMSDFVVDDADSVVAEDGSEPIMYAEEEFTTSSTRMMDRSQAFKVVMESMLLRALNPDHFETEEFRTDKDIAAAFNKVFDPLEALIQDIKSQAWRKEFVDALQYTQFTAVSWANYSSQSCEACNRKDRYASYLITLSGYRYNRRSLKPLEEDDEGGEDDEGSADTPLADATFHVGKYCEQRAQICHDALHYKLGILDTCTEKTGRKEFIDKSADAIVEELIINDAEWIEDEYKLYRSLLDRTADLIRRRSNTRDSEFNL